MDSIGILLSAPWLMLQLAVDGVLIGALFALAAYGMALVWGVMNIINIAQGEFVMLGGFVTLFVAQAGYHPLLLGVPASAVALFVLGWIIYRLIIFRIVDGDLFISILATFGISILLQQLANQLFGADVRTVSADLGSVALFGGNLVVGWIKVIAFFAALLLGAGLFLFLKFSRLGQAIRATSQNSRAARILGVDTDRVYAATYAINAAICGAAGGLVVMTWFTHPFLGLPYTVRSFMIVVVAGLGNLMAVLWAGLGLGIAENYAGFILGAEFQAAFIFLLLVVILVWRNHRLARRRMVLK
ncbi:MAG: branched-chain amino acid ABC transporter permease [Candidatus Lambdaproteobacteria bacterium]|nr:branched-chain amino acid ABC transporter permease [Candidatus Lambdaproteobacteria bacterium]